MTEKKLSRRTFLANSALAAGATALATAGMTGFASAAGLTVGFIYVGPKDDFGYNQSHAEGAAAVVAATRDRPASRRWRDDRVWHDEEDQARHGRVEAALCET